MSSSSWLVGLRGSVVAVHASTPKMLNVLPNSFLHSMNGWAEAAFLPINGPRRAKGGAGFEEAGLNKIERFEISSDGRTVWVNGEAALLGRFGVMGIDIHRPVDEQNSLGECLHCTHGPTGLPDWEVFVIKMKEHFDIQVPDKFKPLRFR
jgi:hypothetical protein